VIDIKRQKLINAIIYFVKNTKNCKKMKLFKLLYFLDFIHFKLYGNTVTGLDYFAWPMGPVPRELYNEFSSDDNLEDFKNYFRVDKETDLEDPKKYSFNIILKQKTPDMSVFTPKEKKILEDIVFQFKDVTAKDMSEITHLKNMPWDKTIKQKGENALIDYELAIDEDTKLPLEDIRERFKLERALTKH
jgi:uncharacterized phage-associated protein